MLLRAVCNLGCLCRLQNGVTQVSDLDSHGLNPKLVWCNFPHSTFWLFCLHLALFTCTELIISTLRSVGTPALCLHWHLHLPTLGGTRACTGGHTCLHWVSHLSALATGVVCHGRGVCRHRGTDAAVAPIGFSRSLY